MKSGKVVQFSAQSDIFGKIAIIQQTRQLDLKEMFCYLLGPVPWFIANCSGDMAKTSKSALMAELEKGTTDVEQIQKPFASLMEWQWCEKYLLMSLLDFS